MRKSSTGSSWQTAVCLATTSEQVCFLHDVILAAIRINVTSNLGVQPQRMWKFSKCFNVHYIYKLLEEFADDKVCPVRSCRSGCKVMYVVRRANQLVEAAWLRAE